MENTLEIADLRAGFPTEKGVAMPERRRSEN